MDPTAQAILVGAISAGFVAGLGAIGIFIINQRASRSTAKQSDLERLENSYAHLQETYEAANAALNLALAEERTARRADRQACESRIALLEQQVVELTRKLPDPGTPGKVIIVGADVPKDKKGKPAFALPMEIVGPLPLPTTAAERLAAALDEVKAEAEGLTVEESK